MNGLKVSVDNVSAHGCILTADDLHGRAAGGSRATKVG